MVADQHSGQGGSYLVGSDGVRRLVFRTGLNVVSPEPEMPKAKPAKRMKSSAPEEGMSDGQMA